MEKAYSGIQGLDKILDHIRIGDNVVWQIDELSNYMRFVTPFVQKSLQDKKNLIYMRFAGHPPLLDAQPGLKIYTLNAYEGFESFCIEVANIIEQEGKYSYYVFDSLSELLSAWATDLMIGNFFMVTCPYLFEMDTIAYFAIKRTCHSYKSIARIRETTQLLLDIYHIEENYYIHPLKVWKRYTPTMFHPHIEKNGQFLPITNSADASKLFESIQQIQVCSINRNLDYWEQIFLKAAEAYVKIQKNDPEAKQQEQKLIKKIASLIIGREEKILALACQFMDLKDLLDIKSRLLGSGFIGGKTAGMLLARAILLKQKDFNWSNVLENHDSYYIGSDVFYSYLIENGCWKLRLAQRKKENYFSKSSELKEKILAGHFPYELQEKFKDILEHFGPSPIIVRSSSLLEDGFGNAFAGKYESIFCVNQGNSTSSFHQFEEAIKKVYASTMNEDALTYRFSRGLDEKDEQMALLVQRVSGSYHQQYYFPFLAGVGFSYNMYVWKKEMDPGAGMLRLVFGLGTRAVDRHDNDYPRIVALDQPAINAVSNQQDRIRFSQKNIDLLDISDNEWKTLPVQQILAQCPDLKLDLIAERDGELMERLRALGRYEEHWILTFEELLAKSDFPMLMQKLLKTIEKNYNYPVDTEFTVNQMSDQTLRINLLQCRPQQTQGAGRQIQIPEDIAPEKILFAVNGNFMGGSTTMALKRIIYIDPENYSLFPVARRYEIANIVGKLNRLLSDKESCPTMLFGPGRWGTNLPSMGVPVKFSDINQIKVLVEMEYMTAGFTPELSYGSHFFQDLVEENIFYIGIFPNQEEVLFNALWFKLFPNSLVQMLPEFKEYEDIVKVLTLDNQPITFLADMHSQKVLCYELS